MARGAGVAGTADDTAAPAGALGADSPAARSDGIAALEKRLRVCEQEVARLVRVCILMGEAGQTLEERVDEMEGARGRGMVVATLVKPS